MPLVTKPVWGEAEGYMYEELMVYGWLLQILLLIRILLLKDKEVAEEITHLMGHFSICLLTRTTPENKYGMDKMYYKFGDTLKCFSIRDFFL